MKGRIASAMNVCLLALVVASLVTAVPVRARSQERPLVQVALLLDTSGSMQGLIDQAKTQLWKVVNELLSARRRGQKPRIQVALYEYGKDSLPAAEGYIRQIVGLTADLDKVSEELFALRTNGGSEYCGQVIQQAVRELGWSKSSRDLKVIFIAGNEPFTQGPVDFRKAVKQAVSRGIIVNTIHCGSEAEGIRGKWKEGAMLADGAFMVIDQNRRVPQIAAPQDKRIAELNRQLNDTYIPIGTRGRARKARQAAVDKKAKAAAPAAAAERAVYKASGAYQAADWDLVEAEATGRASVDQLDDEQLPANMRSMSKSERKQYVEQQKKKRAELQARIRKLAAERKAYISKKQRELATQGPKTLDQAIIETVHAQAKKKQFRFAK